MLSKFSVKKPMTVFVAVILVILLGAISFTSVTMDLLPEMELPYLIVITPYPGASPEKVETEVTKPLEAALASTEGIENISSTSSENSGMVVLQFVQGTNMDTAMLNVSSSIDLISGSFDDKVSTPILMEMNPNMLPVMVATVDMDGKDVTELSAFLEETLQPALERVGGVASVETSGAIEKEIRVELDQGKIDALNRRILASVDESLADAQDELDSARAELAGQKSQLDSKGQSGMSSLVTSGQQLQQGKDQLEAGKLTIQEAEKTLTESLAAAREQRTQLDQAEEALQNKPALEAGLTEVNSALEQVRQGREQLSAQRDLLTEQRDQLEAAGDAEGAAAVQAQIDALDAQLAALTAQEAELEKKRAELQTALDAVAALEAQGLKTVEDVKAAKAKADEGIAQLEAGLQEVKRQKAELQKGEQQLQSGESQLETGKLKLTQELTKASVLLSLGEQQLDEAQEEFETSRDKAYEQAGLDGILTQEMLKNMLSAQNFNMPAGYLQDGDGEEQILLKVGDEFESLEELQNLVLFSLSQGDIGDVTLAQVANVGYADNAGERYAKINGNDGIILSFTKQSTASTATVCDEIEARGQELMDQYEGLHFTSLSNQGMYIHLVIDSVLENLGWGALLAVVLLLLFLRSWRPTLVVACSIPISLMAAVTLMYFTGVNLNMISLSGLALAVGMLVDNSIVVIENIYRLRQKGVSPATAAMHGARQVAGAIAASTLTTVCVFLPIVFTQGLSRQLFTDMGLTIGYALVASLVVALTLVPAMSAGVLKRPPKQPGRLFEGLVNLYERALRFTLRHKLPVLLLALVLLVASVFLELSRGTAFMPDMDSRQIGVSLEMPEGATTEETRDMATKVTDRILELPDVETVGAMEGGGMMGMGGSGSSGSVTMYVVLREDKKSTSQEVASQIQSMMEDLDCTVEASGSSMDLTALYGEGVTVQLKGSDLDTLQEQAKAIGEVVGQVEGISAVDTGEETAAKEVRVVVDKGKAVGAGLTVAQVYQQLAAKIPADQTATNIRIDNYDYPVIVVAAQDGSALTRQNLESAVVTGKEDEEEKDIPLTDIASVEEGTGLTSIKRDNQVRTLTVSATLAEGHNIGLVSTAVERALADFELPEGYTMEFTGENKTINDSFADLYLMVALAIVFIYLIMVAQFQSLKSPFIVLLTIPLAFTGGLLGLYVCGMELSVIALLGFLVLAGIIVNNGIVFVDYANQLRLEGMEKRAALVETGRARLRPILMTALTTILGLATMAFGMGMGGDMVQPMAITTVGGLIYATLLTLFVVPAMYDLMHRKEMKRVEVDEEIDD